MGSRSKGGYKDPLNYTAVQETKRTPKPKPPKKLVIRYKRVSKPKWKHKPSPNQERK